MSLRARLVAALVGLLALGIVVYGVGTTRAFARTQLARLDQEMRQALPLVQRELVRIAGQEVRGERETVVPGGRRPAVRVAPGTYAALLGPAGRTLAELQIEGRGALPDLADVDVTAPAGPTTVPTAAGDGRWRVLVDDGPLSSTIVVAVPTTSLDLALRRLVAIQIVAGLALLAAMAAGAWLIVRGGLRPLERMASAATAVTPGTLHQRVPVEGAAPEVAQLGTALNGMLDDLQRAFAEREASEARLRRFVADASHELRTPLTSIQGYAELFRLGRDTAHVDGDVVARRIEEESARMRRLVEDLLVLARLDQPREPVRQPVDLAVLAADACSDLVAMDPDRPIELDAPEPVAVLGDEGHLRQAVANLAANALRHTPAGTPIEVTARRDGQQAVLAVRDHGPGFDADAAVHAFDRFWQADPARAGTGAGLGLAIVQAVAAEHGGTATAATHPGGGAIVTLTLPLAPVQEPLDAP